MAKDLYATLGLKKEASEKDIRKAYRQLARKHHPDVNPGDKASETRFKEINSAYEVLKDPEKRKKYDRFGENWEYGEQYEAARRAASATGRRYSSGGNSYTFEGGGVDGFEDLGGGGLGDILGGIFGRGGGRAAPRRPQNVEHAVDVSLEEAYQGATRTIQLEQREICPTCSGAGQVAGAVCHVCGGAGVVLAPQRIEVKIPAGVRSGSKVRIAGKGGAGANGAVDLILVVNVINNPRFERRGDDLYTDVNVDLADALLGGEVAVQTMKGSSVMLRIPEATQNGRSFRLRGLGMPHLGGSEKGDLFARVTVRLPESLTAEQKKAVEAFRKQPAESKK